MKSLKKKKKTFPFRNNKAYFGRCADSPPMITAAEVPHTELKVSTSPAGAASVSGAQCLGVSVSTEVQTDATGTAEEGWALRRVMRFCCSRSSRSTRVTWGKYYSSMDFYIIHNIRLAFCTMYCKKCEKTVFFTFFATLCTKNAKNCFFF